MTESKFSTLHILLLFNVETLVALERIFRRFPREYNRHLETTYLLSTIAVVQEVLEINVAAKLLDKFLGDGDAEADTVLVDIFDYVEVSKPLANEAHFFDALARILDHYFQIVAVNDLYTHKYSPIERVFHSIIHYVNKNLTDPLLILINDLGDVLLNLNVKVQ